MSERNDHERKKNEQCDKKLSEQKEDMTERCEKDIRDATRSEIDRAGVTQIKLMNSWNIKCKKEKDAAASDEIEKCVK